ncbi:MAG: hypothetical protein EOP20_00800 [Hyphomicrobiales bacterium]|nr:MAG: hypothetical protein EOP20_00800 [Hyphomicrobiales bacterium]
MSDLTTAAKEARALEAERILTDDTIAEAVIAMRAYGLEQLLHVDPSDAQKVAQLQAYVAATDAFRGQLGAFIAQGKPQPKRTGLA